MKSDTLNPYKEAAALLKNRALFDLNPLRLKHFFKFKALKNKYANQKCVIICNGPSLKDIDFNLIADAGVFTIGLNKINLFFDKMPFRPNLIAAINEHVVDQNIDFFSETDIPLYLEYVALKRSAKLGRVVGKPNLHLIYATDISNRFAKDISWSVCPGFTVTYVAMQIAYHLGFSQVTLIGCDHNFSSKGVSNALVTQEGQEENHFVANYFPPGASWHLPDLLGSEFHYQLARDTFNENNRQLWNSTVGGKLELMTRISLADFLRLPELKSVEI